MVQKAVATAVLTVVLVGTSDWTEAPSRVGAAQGGPTTGEEMQEPFDPVTWSVFGKWNGILQKWDSSRRECIREQKR